MLSNISITIHQAQASDAGAIAAFRTQSTFEYLGDPNFFSEDQVVAWLARLPSSSRRMVIRAKNLSQTFIGVIRIDHIDHLHGTCQLGLDIWEEQRKKGYGRLAYELILEYLFEYFNMHMIYLYVMENNEVAIKLYEKLGFKETGRLPGAIHRHGQRFDYILMSKVKTQ